MLALSYLRCSIIIRRLKKVFLNATKCTIKFKKHQTNRTFVELQFNYAFI